MELDFQKMPDQLIPAIVQDADTGQVLMLGYVNAEAWAQTQAQGRVTFYSRTKKRLWIKGETSGNYLQVVSLHADCDQDAVLVLARPAGPTCHRGTTSCFEPLPDGVAGHLKAVGEVARFSAAESVGSVAAHRPSSEATAPASPMPLVSLLVELDQLIARRQQFPAEEPGSYTVRLFQKGLARMAQKVGEEAVETVIEAMAGNRAALAGEAADLVFHLLVLLRAAGSSLAELLLVLRQRHQTIASGQRRPLPD